VLRIEENHLVYNLEDVFQVALIVFLSHIGSFVPAESATVGLTDWSLEVNTFFNHLDCHYIEVAIMLEVLHRIFCAMGSKLMTAEQSTFMIDLHQVGMMLRHVYLTMVFFTMLVLNVNFLPGKFTYHHGVLV